jgi:hypothetical protein
MNSESQSIIYKHDIVPNSEDGVPFCRKCHCDMDSEEAVKMSCKYGTEIEQSICPHCNKKVDHLVYNPVCQLYECDICRYLHR